MENNILIIYGSLNSVPSPEGAAPAKVIYETVESLDMEVKVLSNYNEKLKDVTYNKNTFLHVKAGWIDNVLLVLLKMRYSFAKRKELFITADNRQLLYFIAVCRFLRFSPFNKLVVHVAPGLVTMIKIFLLKKEVVFYHHGTSLHSKLNSGQWKRLLNNSKSIIGVNNQAKIEANKVFEEKILDAKYYKVANGIKMNDTLGLNSKKAVNRTIFTILFTGRICEEKGVLNLIKAFELVYLDHKNTQLIIIGGAGTKRNLKAGQDHINRCLRYATRKKLPIEFTGFLPQESVYEFLKQGDLLVLPTNPLLYQEGMPLSLLEGMSFGLPLIATNSGGNKEIVLDKYNGFVITAQENYHLEMAEKIGQLISDNALHKKFSNNSLALFEKKHTAKAMAEGFKTVLKKLQYV